jgi:hypothetical protein
MATPSLSISFNNANKVLTKLDTFRIDSQILEAKYQHFISEMIMLRLFSVFEDCVADIAYKLAAGAIYSNGNIPHINIRANTVSASRGLFLSHGRARPIQYLKWTKAKYIKESVEHVIPHTEKYITYAQIHGATIDEMRKVRNTLAHNTTTARSDFKDIVRQIYGANINISVGAFLTSTRRTHISNLERYITSTRIILSDLISGR